MRTIVVGYDGSDAAGRALGRAAQLAEVFGSTLVVVHATPVDEETPEAVELDRAEALLAGRRLRAEFQPALGEAADAIVEVARRREADLAVVGTRRPGAVQRLLGHSVSETVSRLAHCDVLIVR